MKIIEESNKDLQGKGGYGFYFYSGSDEGVRCDNRIYYDPETVATNTFGFCTRRPANNRFVMNLIDGSESHPIKIRDADRNSFVNNTINGDLSSSNAHKVHITNALNTLFVDNILTNIRFSLSGGTSTNWPYTQSRSTLVISENAPDLYEVKLSDSFSSVHRIINTKTTESLSVVISCPNNRHLKSPVNGPELD